MALPRVYLVIRMRPEAVKPAPVARALRAAGIVEPVLVVTGQHQAAQHRVRQRPRHQHPRFDNWTFALDARILARTAGVVIRGDGAY
jgi:lipopolysaccharide/colanic/teichoic acid biosynthesis glycosyltransferase